MAIQMKVRRADPAEYYQIWQLFHETIHHVNSADYSQEQLNAWSPEEYQSLPWETRMRKIDPIVAVVDGTIVGFSDLQTDGLIDMFYVHHQWQRQGVGRLLMDEINRLAFQLTLHTLHSYVSITAMPFFERHGFSVVRAQQVEVRGLRLQNFLMQKQLVDQSLPRR